MLCITSVITLAPLPNVVSGQAINLGAAASFCLFIQDGAITDGNSALKSNITGRLGTYGTYSGFNPVYNTSVAGAPPQHETNQNTLLQVANAVDPVLAKINIKTTSPMVLANALGSIIIPPSAYDMPTAIAERNRDLGRNGVNQSLVYFQNWRGVYHHRTLSGGGNQRRFLKQRVLEN